MRWMSADDEKRGLTIVYEKFLDVIARNQEMQNGIFATGEEEEINLKSF